MVKPLNAWNLAKFTPCDIQLDEFKPTVELFKNGFPPHQGIVYDGKRSILLFGFIDMGEGQYYAWTLFGKHFQKKHMKFCIDWANNYLNLLEFSSIHHIIRKEYYWTKKMISMFGFKYVRDEDDNMEHWVRL
jgi:hypothetical protein